MDTEVSVEVTKKELSNYVTNGQVSKEFIKKNKEELQKFIKSKKRDIYEVDLTQPEALPKLDQAPVSHEFET